MLRVSIKRDWAGHLHVTVTVGHVVLMSRTVNLPGNGEEVRIEMQEAQMPATGGSQR